MLVHSTLMVDAASGEPLGLIDQHRWTRPSTSAGCKRKRQNRPYQDKESVKWEQATSAMCERLSDTSNVITVCDREADIYEYLVYLTDQDQRFVVRASHDRKLVARKAPDHKLVTRKASLFDVMAKQPVVETREVEIAQRGFQRGTSKQKQRSSRPSRTAIMSIRTLSVELARPVDRSEGPESLKVSVVYLREQNAPKGVEPAEWLLLTSEPISEPEEFNQVIQHYEHRWLIEEFHKSWKTGCRIEERRLQSTMNLERMMAITAPIAVRLLQLRALSQTSPTSSCTIVLKQEQWQCLFAKVEPKRPIPKRPPTIQWAITALAKLAGWRDTKRTGRIGWQTLWLGWARLEALVEGWLLAKRGT
jgi:hypothetical protein